AAAAVPAATTTTAAATAAALASSHGTSFVHYDSAAHQIAAVAGLDRTVRSARIVDVDKPESPGFAGEPVTHYIYCVYGHTRLREKRFNIGLACPIRQVAHKKSHGFNLLISKFGRGRVTTADRR